MRHLLRRHHVQLSTPQTRSAPDHTAQLGRSPSEWGGHEGHHTPFLPNFKLIALFNDWFTKVPGKWLCLLLKPLLRKGFLHVHWFLEINEIVSVFSQPSDKLLTPFSENPRLFPRSVYRACTSSPASLEGLGPCLFLPLVCSAPATLACVQVHPEKGICTCSSLGKTPTVSSHRSLRSLRCLLKVQPPKTVPDHSVVGRILAPIDAHVLNFWNPWIYYLIQQIKTFKL